MNPKDWSAKAQALAVLIVTALIHYLNKKWDLGIDPGILSAGGVTGAAAVAVIDHGEPAVGPTPMSDAERATAKSLLPPALAAKLGLCALVAGMLTAGASPVAAGVPARANAGAGGAANAIRGGDASGKQGDSIPLSGLAGSYMGAASQSNLHTEQKREVQSTQAGTVMTGFMTSSVTGDALKWVADRTKDDPVLAVLNAQANSLLKVLEAKPGDAPMLAALKDVTTQMTARLTDIAKATSTIGGADLSHLTTIIVMNFANGLSNGSDTKALNPTEAEAEQKMVESVASRIWALMQQAEPKTPFMPQTPTVPVTPGQK